MLRSEQSSGAAATDGIWNIVKDTGMSDSTWHGTIASEVPKHEAQGTVLPPAPEQDTIPVEPDHKHGTVVPKRNHNRRPGSTDKGRLPLTTEQKQQAVTLAAAGYAPSRVAKTMGKSRLMVKRHLEAPETIVKVEDERMQLVEIYKDKARACAVGITDEKIAKSSALQLATASGICTDKALLLQGMPTEINLHVHALVDVLDTIRQLRDEREEREDEEARAAAKARALLSLPANQAGIITLHKPEGAL